ncbi:MAG: DNA-directed RNA polymerase subunit omega [Candidatus Riflebacteria bacterium]|jgi:DNA-directed RNA polymerase subunit K/omega|nr:DNA-directed RNA polymerase subunit omega [Candidatus Riflebacteria bacterium]MDD3000453.1 DNA-directed RNA polymerase subunit omega [Candidatus Riflebacteria bacterium]MDD3376705.1 DNA-directed RNA polymerase subunit omega [Candidatus Riflebacteria bacterium]NCB45376.1 DNA-directed RNA polymerase subunit omega [bacterium]NLV94087.1 DNA-directed RNA polymerase subunit omega [Candidatus Riflebacteria bacterium]
MKFRSRTEIIKKIPNKYDAVMAISNRVKMLVEGKRRLIDEYDENFVKIAMEEIASGALDVEIQDKEK